MSSSSPHSLPGIRLDQPVTGPAAPSTPGIMGESAFPAEGDVVQRIDSPHRRPQSGPGADDDVVSSSGEQSRDHWLRQHAGDLIDRLQRWSNDLDARQTQLNASMAQHDLRERQFRLRQQEIEAGLQRQQEQLNAITAEVQAQARRLAFQRN